jgi:hypothetical protein
VACHGAVSHGRLGSGCWDKGAVKCTRMLLQVKYCSRSENWEKSNTGSTQHRRA